MQLTPAKIKLMDKVQLWPNKVGHGAVKELFEHFKWRYECTRFDQAYFRRKRMKSRHQRVVGELRGVVIHQT